MGSWTKYFIRSIDHKSMRHSHPMLSLNPFEHQPLLVPYNNIGMDDTTTWYKTFRNRFLAA
jgi:hypothetical protein